MAIIPALYFKPLKRAAFISATACLAGFLTHQAFGWMPLFIEHWLTTRKEEFMAASHFQHFGLLTLGLSGAIVTTTALGREPVLSGRLFWQSGIQVLYIGSSFVGVILGLALSVAVKQGIAAASSGFLLAFVASVFMAMVLGLSFVLLQFLTIKFRSQRAAKYRKEITVALGVSVFLIAAWGLWAELSANAPEGRAPEFAR